MNPHATPTSMRRLLALATLAAASATVGAAGPPGHSGPQALGMGGPAMGRMLEQVGASAEQRSQVEQIMAAARSDLQASRKHSRALHEQMRALFAQPTVDAAAVETLRLQTLEQHDQTSRRMTQAMLDVSTVLSAEQRQQLAQITRQRAEQQHGKRGRERESRRGERPDA